MFLGIDTGLTSTGLCLVNTEGKLEVAESIVVPKNFEDRNRKIDWISNEFELFVRYYKSIYKIRFCFMENHANMRISRKSKSIYDLNRLDGRFEQILKDNNTDLLYIEPQHIKYFVGCNLRSGKEKVIQNTYEIYGVNFESFGKSESDVTDSFILSMLLYEIGNFKKNPKEYAKKYPNKSSILLNYSAFVNDSVFKEDVNV